MAESGQPSWRGKPIWKKILGSVTLFRYILAQSKNPGQSQKELFHNEALLILDTISAAAVEGPPQDDPPQSPVPGTCYLVGAAPTDDWTAYGDHLAAYGSAGWRFVPPLEGLTVLLKTSGETATYRSGAGAVGTLRASRLLVDGVQVIGAQAAAVPNPEGGSTVDSEARATLEQILGALRAHGLIAAE